MGDKNVFRLEIAVNNVPFVGGDQALRYLQRIGCGLTYRDGAFVQALAQSFAFEQLGNDVGNRAVESDVEDG